MYGCRGWLFARSRLDACKSLHSYGLSNLPKSQDVVYMKIHGQRNVEPPSPKKPPSSDPRVPSRAASPVDVPLRLDELDARAHLTNMEWVRLDAHVSHDASSAAISAACSGPCSSGFSGNARSPPLSRPDSAGARRSWRASGRSVCCRCRQKGHWLQSSAATPSQDATDCSGEPAPRRWGRSLLRASRRAPALAAARRFVRAGRREYKPTNDISRALLNIGNETRRRPSFACNASTRRLPAHSRAAQELLKSDRDRLPSRASDARWRADPSRPNTNLTHLRRIRSSTGTP